MSSNDEYGLVATLRRYWRAYGGWRAVFCSPYFWLSVVLTLLTCRFWWSDPWWDQVLSVMPNMLGFTLGGFAVFLGFGDEKFKSLISGQDEGSSAPSPYMMVSATFLHFVLIQLCALLFAIVVKATRFTLPGNAGQQLSAFLSQLNAVGSLFGYWLFLYGLCIVAAAALAIFRVAFWYDSYQTAMREED